MRKLLITGGKGQLARALNVANLNNFRLFFCSHDELNITSPASIKQALLQYQPDMVINTAAYTAVDKAEQETDLALQANLQGPLNLAVLCRKKQIPLLHISTDYVFDGASKTPYTTEDKTNPINAYGETKLLGEMAIREQLDQHIILRVSGIFSEFGNNFYKTILRLAKERPELRVVTDQVTCPTYAGHLAQVILDIAKNPEHYGTYHYCDTPAVSWFQFAEQIIRAANLTTKIHGITTAEYPAPAKRPTYSVLNCSKLQKDYAIKQQQWYCAINKLALEII